MGQVFLIQNTQNRDTKALHLKLDEIIRAIEKAHNALIQAEDLPEDELRELKEQDRALGDETAGLPGEIQRAKGEAADVKRPAIEAKDQVSRVTEQLGASGRPERNGR